MGRSAKPGIERRKAILKILRSGTSVDTGKLAHQLGVSEMTIRRDLKELEDRREVLRSYGGAALARRVHIEFQFASRQQVMLQAKRAIAAYAANLVQPNETIFIDTGTTALEFARELARRDVEVTVATPSLAVGSELWGQEHVRVLILGGQLRVGSPDLTGPISARSLDLIQATKAFLGCEGLLLDRGAFGTDPDRANLSATMVKNAAWRCLLTDSTKIEKPASVRYATFSEFDQLVMDDQVSPEILGRLKSLFKHVQLVKVRNKSTNDDE